MPFVLAFMEWSCTFHVQTYNLSAWNHIPLLCVSLYIHWDVWGRAVLLKGNRRLRSLLQFVNRCLFLFTTSLALVASESSVYAVAGFHFVDSFYAQIGILCRMDVRPNQ